MKKIFFFLALLIAGVMQSKAQQKTSSVLFPNKATEFQALQKNPEKQDANASLPAKQRIFQNYSPAAPRSRVAAKAKRAAVQEKMASEAPLTPDDKKEKPEVKITPIPSQSNEKQ